MPDYNTGYDRSLYGIGNGTTRDNRRDNRRQREIGRNDFIQHGRVGSHNRSQRAGELEQMLMDQSMGKGPSLADAHLRMAGDQAMAQQQSLAAGARPGMGGMAQRMAAQNIGRIGANIAQQSVAARLQEQLQARAALAQMLAQQRQLDLQQAGTEKKPGWEQYALQAAGVALPAAATIFGD